MNKAMWRVRWIPMGESSPNEAFLESERDAREYPHSGATVLDIVRFDPSPDAELTQLRAENQALQKRVTELTAERDKLKGYVKGSEVLADEKCKWFLIRAQKAEQQLLESQGQVARLRSELRDIASGYGTDEWQGEPQGLAEMAYNALQDSTPAPRFAEVMGKVKALVAEMADEKWPAEVPMRNSEDGSLNDYLVVEWNLKKAGEALKLLESLGLP